MDRVLSPNNPSFYVPSSEPFSTGFTGSLYFLCLTTMQLPTTVCVVLNVGMRVRGGSTYRLISVLRYIHSALWGGHKQLQHVYLEYVIGVLPRFELCLSWISVTIHCEESYNSVAQAFIQNPFKVRRDSTKVWKDCWITCCLFCHTLLLEWSWQI